MVNGFIGLLKLLTTKIYSTIANSRTLQIILAHINSSQSLFIRRCLATNPTMFTAAGVAG
jgi:hypothetical protein